VFVDVDAFPALNLVEVLLGGYADADSHVGGVGGQGIESNIRSLADRWRRAHASQGHGPRRKYVSYLFGLCMSYRIEALRRVGGFDLAFRTNAEDMDVGLRMNAAGLRLLYLPEAKVFHQRRDDVASLRYAIAAWYRAAYGARRKNHAGPWRLFAGTLRRIVMDPLRDLIIAHDPVLARLSISMCFVKLAALRRASESA
jgi:GT2 family glycosyltransferase